MLNVHPIQGLPISFVRPSLLLCATTFSFSRPFLCCLLALLFTILHFHLIYLQFLTCTFLWPQPSPFQRRPPIFINEPVHPDKGNAFYCYLSSLEISCISRESIHWPCQLQPRTCITIRGCFCYVVEKQVEDAFCRGRILFKRFFRFFSSIPNLMIHRSSN